LFKEQAEKVQSSGSHRRAPYSSAGGPGIAGQKLCLGAEYPREPTLIEATTTYPGVAAEAVVRKRKNGVITGFNRFGQAPLFVEIWSQLPKIVPEIKFTDGIEVARRDAQAAAERLEARLREVE
jgi:hypothetical protein